MTAIRITGGRVHDPANAVDGEIRDVCIEGGKVVAEVGPKRGGSTLAAWW